MTPEMAAAAFARMADELAQPHELMQKLVLTVEAAAKRRTPVRTGTLRRSITSRVDTATKGRVGTNVSYAPYVHEGARGTPGRPFLRWGVEDSQGDIERLLVQYGQQVFAKAR